MRKYSGYLVVVCVHGGEKRLVALHELLRLLQVGGRLVLAQQVLLLAQQHLNTITYKEIIYISAS